MYSLGLYNAGSTYMYSLDLYNRVLNFHIITNTNLI